MSWKGLQKAVNRLPHQIKAATGYSEETKDQEFKTFEARFTQIEKAAVQLHSDAQKYRDGISAFMMHEVSAAETLVDLYNPINGRDDGAVLRRHQTPAHALQAVQTFHGIVEETRDILMPLLDDLDRRVVQPLADFITVTKLIRKTITKRNHKQVDFDRFRNSLKKLREKKERSLSDEKNMFKLESQYELATQEYNYYNDLLKAQLPVFFEQKDQFIDPLFHSFYVVQFRIFEILNERLQEAVNAGGYDMNTDILLAYDRKKSEIQNELEELTLLSRKSLAKATTAHFRNNIAPAVGGSQPGEENGDTAPPPYTPAANPEGNGFSSPLHRSASTASSSSMGGNLRSGIMKFSTKVGVSEQRMNSILPKSDSRVPSYRAPPPPPPAPRVAREPPKEYVIALYDYTGEEGDLSFRKDDKIEIVEKTQSTNDWWTGRLNGKTGLFPANYVAQL
ncbi:uncharacterized protein VTP21DRAFT_67 [Calcarisporiella thermophila]|uniref:uncharacterized protein n=1 Tax=Calcarisporiella thermophila TaxID=911321 RepID=UPI0037435010